MMPDYQPRYRVRWRLGGFEPQMSYIVGLTGETRWFPLTSDGYWLEPEAFSSGKITKHISMSRGAAKRATLRARAINNAHIAAAG